jgi:hypothetical protein
MSNTTGWMVVIVVFAGVMTPFIAMAEGWMVWWGNVSFGPDAEGLLTVGPMLAVGALLFAPLAMPSAVPRIVRTALLVPLFHIGLMIGLYAIWANVDLPLIKDSLVLFLSGHDIPLLARGEVLAYGAVAGLAVIALSLVHGTFRARRNVPTWVRPAVTFSITYLFTLGLWLPIAADVWSSYLARGGDDFLIAVLAVPMIPALIVAVRTLSPAAWSGRGCGNLGICLAISLGVAVAIRTSAGPTSQMLFANLIPVILCAALVTLGSVIALALCQWRELRYHRADGARTGAWVQRGIVEAPLPAGTPIGVIRFAGWLGGFRTELAPFAIRTDRGTLVQVPRGSQLSAAPGPESARAVSGDYVIALRVGDPVAATGYEEPVADGPFRSSAAPIPSDKGVLVFGPHNPPTRVGLSLLLWRPCALYLLAAMAAVIPALLGTE